MCFVSVQNGDENKKNCLDDMIRGKIEMPETL